MTPKQEAALRQDYWQEEARRYAQNAEFWRGKYEAATAQQQEPVVWMYINRITHETSFQKQMRSFVDHSQWKEVPLYSEPLANHEFQCVCGAVWCGDEMVHLPDKRPQPSKPLTDEQRKAIVVCFTSGKVSVSEVQRKLAISYNEAQQLCQSIVDLKLAQGLQLAPSLDRHGIKGAE